MTRILNAEPLGYSDEARAVLRGLGRVVEAPLSRTELLSQLSEYAVLIVRLAHQVDREVIDAGTNLKAIVTATTGLDHIDVGYARERGIRVLSLKGETAFLRTVSATAEHTWALLLSLMRRVPQAAASVRSGNWDRDSFRGHELESRRLGIVGLGRIGCKVARYGQAFGMEVAAHDPYVEQWSDGVAREETLHGLMRHSDVLSLHVPLNEETEGMIGEDELALLPPGAVLVNTSRAEVVDEGALVRALGRGHLMAAGLDFIANERDGDRRAVSPLLAYARNNDNLLITPHLGGATHESMARTEIFMARKLEAFLSTVKKEQVSP